MYQKLAEGRCPDLIVDELANSGWPRETIDAVVWAAAKASSEEPGGKLVATMAIAVGGRYLHRYAVLDLP